MGKVKIWYDACTGKHVRYGTVIARHLRRKNFDFILTTRNHPDTIMLAKHLKEDFMVIGNYDPSSNLTRLREGLKRQIRFCEMFKDEPPDIAISHGSVDLCRVAFGLRIPTISTFDSPHAEAVNRLTIPLVDVLVTSKAIPIKNLKKYGARRIITFDGVDEVAWIKNYRSKAGHEYGRPLILVRQLETRAVYAEGKIDVMEEIAHKLTSIGRVIFLPRYERKPRGKLIIPKGFVDTAELAGQADIVISPGGTIAREAALQGTPSIVVNILLKKSYVNEYLSKKGFPIFTVNVDESIKYAQKYIGRKDDVKALLDGLENPVDVIEEVIEEIKKGG